MMMRSQRHTTLWRPHHVDDAERGSTRLSPRVIAQAGGGAELAIIADVPGVGWRYVAGDDGSFSMLLDEPGHPDGSWAVCGYEPGADEYVVTEYGDRRLWAEVSAAYLRWLSQGRPGLVRYGMTVTPDGQKPHLGDPVSRER